MTDPDAPLPRGEAMTLARVMLDPFAASPSRWKRSDPLDPEFESWRDLYGKIEDTRAAATPEGCRALGEAIAASRVLDRDPSHRADPRHPLRHHVTSCHAVAETLLRNARNDGEIALAEAILKACPPRTWEKPYFDLLAEVFDDDGNAALAATLAAETCRLADEERVPEHHGLIPDILTAVDVAAFLQVSLVTFRRHLTDGSIPSRKFGRQRYIMKEDFLNVLAAKDVRHTRGSP